MLLLTLAPASVLPQTEQEAPGRFRVGPLFFTPALEVRSGADTNVFNDTVRPIPDAVTVIRSELDTALAFRERLRLTGRGSVDFSHFYRQETERSTGFAGEGRAELSLGPFSFFSTGGGGQTRQRFSLEIDERLRRQERWASAGLDLSLSEALQVRVSGTLRRYTYEAGRSSAKAALDRDERTGSAELRYSVATFTRAVVSLDTREDRFLGRERGAARLVRPYRLWGGLEFGEEAVVTGRILAGVRQFPRGTSGTNALAYRAPVVSASIVTTLPALGRVTVSGERDVFYSVIRASGNGGHFNSYVASVVGVNLTSALPLELIGRVEAQLDEVRYTLPVLYLDRAADRLDRRWTTGITLLRGVSRSVRLGGTLAYTRRISNLPGWQCEGLSYGLAAEVAP